MRMRTLAAVLSLTGLLGACRDQGPEENRDVPAGTQNESYQDRSDIESDGMGTSTGAFSDPSRTGSPSGSSPDALPTDSDRGTGTRSERATDSPR
jgi:hypothetical protein